jgi:hypothetical protein
LNVSSPLEPVSRPIAAIINFTGESSARNSCGS